MKACMRCSFIFFIIRSFRWIIFPGMLPHINLWWLIFCRCKDSLMLGPGGYFFQFVFLTHASVWTKVCPVNHVWTQCWWDICWCHVIKDPFVSLFTCQQCRMAQWILASWLLAVTCLVSFYHFCFVYQDQTAINFSVQNQSEILIFKIYLKENLFGDRVL